VVQAIHTTVRGRARYRVSGLYRCEELKRALEKALRRHERVRSASASILTGNLLVVFEAGEDFQFVAVAAIIERVVGDQGGSALSPSGAGSSRSAHPAAKRYPRPSLTRRQLRAQVVHAEDQEARAWHLMPAHSVLERFGTSRKTGLDPETVRALRARYGPNVLPEAIPRSGWSILFGQFKSLPVALLGVAAGISVATGGLADALVILSVVAINATIGYMTESQAERTIHSLKSLVRPQATVVRDGILQELGADEIVPGDLLLLRPGSYVAADARLVQASHLSVDESALTGESLPVQKAVDVLSAADIPLADRVNMVYMGTLVTGGQGIAVVTATGSFTEIGKIQTLVGEARPPETPMERQLTIIGNKIVLIGGVVCGIVFLVGLLRGYGFLQMLRMSISLAVAAVPEGLPAVATTTLALGIQRMRRRNVLIRHLDAVESLGAVQTPDSAIEDRSEK
jgi:Ca2+-transporting ATPase